MPGGFVGITVMPEYYQNETVDAVLDNLVNLAQVTAVTTSPYVMAAVSDGKGQREPPIDAGAGMVRLLDRPLWGKKELQVRTAPSFIANRQLYQGLAYQPPSPNSLTHEDGHLVGTFLTQAAERGLKTYLQVQAAIPPGYRVQFGGPHECDMPLMPDGSLPGKRVAENASLASPDVIAYQRAMIRDLVQAYPQIDGIRFDWPEYPPYEINSIFTDFSPHVASLAGELEIDLDGIRAEAIRCYSLIHEGLTDASVEGFMTTLASRGAESIREVVTMENPLLGDWLRLKRALSDRLLRSFRMAMDEAGREDLELVAHAFPPPWSDLSGIDFSVSSDIVDHFCVKLYGMHWLMMIRSYAEQILAGNSRLDEGVLVPALFTLFDINSGPPPQGLDDVRYPSPGEPHPGDQSTRTRKIRAARAAAGTTPVISLEHGYGPIDDFGKRIETAYKASDSRIWINRYGYLSDDKLRLVREITQQGGPCQ